METRKAEISRIATLVVALCTLVVTALVVRRELLIPNDLPVRGSPPPPVLLDKWEELAEAGHRIGPMDARLVLVEFSDFECPACAFLSNDLVPHLGEQYPGQVAVVYRHWPLQKHRFSYAAARASECAAFQGGFEQFHDVVYSQQHLLGVESLTKIAARAGVPDIEEFESCMSRTGPVPAIERDIETARALGGTGTPTVVMNGWLLTGGVGRERLDSLAHALMAGQAH